jgi:hypothetical protein
VQRLQPLVADFIGTGQTQTVIPVSERLRVRTTGGGYTDVAIPGFDWYGQPAVWGVYAQSNGSSIRSRNYIYTYRNDGVLGIAGLMRNKTNGADVRFIVFNASNASGFSSPTFSVSYFISMPAGYHDTVPADTVCDTDVCYVADDYEGVREVDVVAGTTMRVGGCTIGPSTCQVSAGRMPIALAEVGSSQTGVVVVGGWETDGAGMAYPAVRVFGRDGTNGGAYPVPGLVGLGGFGYMQSNVTLTNLFVDNSDWSSTQRHEAYWGYYDFGTPKAKLLMVPVQKAGGAPAFLTGSETDLGGSNPGYVPQCVGGIASAQCASGRGVLTSSYWSATVTGSVPATRPSLNFNYDASNSSTDFVGLTWDRFMCGDTLCYQFTQGTSTTYPDTVQLYAHGVTGGLTQISMPFFSGSTSRTSWTSFAGPCVVQAKLSDAVLAAGVLGDDLYVLVGQRSNGSMTNVTDGSLTSTRYLQYEIWKYAGGTGVWGRQVQVNDSTGNFVCENSWMAANAAPCGSNAPPQIYTMQCDDTGCSILLRATSDRYTDAVCHSPLAIFIKKSGAIQFNRPRGIVGGYNVNQSYVLSAAKASNNEYYTVKTSDGVSRVVRYAGNQDVTPMEISGSLTAATGEQILALSADPGNSDKVWWVKWRGNGAASCVASSLGVINGVNPFIKTIVDTVNFNYSSSPSLNSRVCNEGLYYSQAGAASVGWVSDLVTAYGTTAGPGYLQETRRQWRGKVTVDSTGATYAIFPVNPSALDLDSAFMATLGSGNSLNYGLHFVQYAVANVTSGTSYPTASSTLGASCSTLSSIGAGTNICQPVMYPDVTGVSGTSQMMPRGTVSSIGAWDYRSGGSSGSVPTIHEYLDLGCYVGGNRANGAWLLTAVNTCPTSIAAVDFNGNGVSDAVLPEAVWDINAGSGLRLKNLSSDATDSSGVLVADVNMDGVVDFVSLTDVQTRYVISYVVGVGSKGPFYSGNVSCSPDATGRIMSVTVSGARSTNINALKYTYVLKGPTDFTGSADKLPSSTWTARVPSSWAAGTYPVIATTTDGASSGSMQGSCVVGALPVMEDVEANCSLAPDGEFKFSDAVANHGWSAEFGEPEKKLGDYLQLKGQQTLVSKTGKFSCQYNIVNLTSRFNVSSAGEFWVEAWGDAVTTTGTNPVPVRIASFRYVDGMLRVGTQSGDGADIQILSSVTMHNVTLEVDKASKVYNVYVDGVSKGQYALEVAAIEYGDVNQLRSGVDGATIWIDYFRTESVGGRVEIGGAKVDEFAALRACGDASERDFDVLPPGSNASIKNYANVQAYCVLSASGGKCGLSDLQEVVRFNSKCYREAFNYCVANSIAQSEDGAVMAQDATVAGATACTAALQIQVASSNVLKPVSKVAWGVVTANITLIVVFVLILIVFVAATRRR